MTPEPAIPAAQSAPPFVALQGPFLRRTAGVVCMTAWLIAAMAAMANRNWSAVYITAAMWGLVFFMLTPYIIKALVFEKKYGAGLALTGLKLVWMGVLFAFCVYWTRRVGSGPGFGSALIAGITTPLVVVVLRALGGGLQDKHGAPSGGAGKESIG